MATKYTENSTFLVEVVYKNNTTKVETKALKELGIYPNPFISDYDLEDVIENAIEQLYDSDDVVSLTFSIHSIESNKLS